MRYRRLGPRTARIRGAVGVVLLAVVGCAPQEPVELDPGVSPFYPGPGAGANPATSSAASADRAASGVLAADQPLRPEDIERQLRLALRAAERGDSVAAAVVLDRILAVEPTNREALSGRAAIALDQAKHAGSPAEQDAALDKAATLIRASRRAYERPNAREIDLDGKVFYEEVVIHTKRDRLDRAVHSLREAYDAGFDAFDRIERDQDLVKLRAFPGYQALVKSIDAANLVKAREKVKHQLDRPLDLPLNFHLKDLDDKPLSLDEFKGRVLLIDFWGTWCKPCREAIPGLAQIYRRHRRRGFEIVGLDYEQGAADPETTRQFVKRFVQESRIPYRIAMADESLLATLNIQSYPTTILVDRSGKPRLLVAGGGPETLDTLNAAILVLLDEPAAASGQSPKPHDTKTPSEHAK